MSFKDLLSRYLDRPAQMAQQYEEDPGGEEEDEPLPAASARTVQRYEQPYQIDLPMTAGAHDKLIDWIVRAAALFGVPILWFVLGLGNSELFSNFSGFTFSNPWTVLSYIFGFASEGFGIALILVAGRAAGQKKWGSMVGSLVMASFMALVSFYAQYALLQAEWLRGALPITDQALAGLPISTHQGVFVLRALVPIVLEFAIVFIFAERNPDAIELLKKKQHYQQQMHLYEQGESLLQQHQTANRTTIRMLEAVGDEFMRRMDTFHEHGVIVQDKQPIYIERPAEPTREVPQHIQRAESALRDTQSAGKTDVPSMLRATVGKPLGEPPDSFVNPAKQEAVKPRSPQRSMPPPPQRKPVAPAQNVTQFPRTQETDLQRLKTLLETDSRSEDFGGDGEAAEN